MFVTQHLTHIDGTKDSPNIRCVVKNKITFVGWYSLLQSLLILKHWRGDLEAAVW
jgi:hypothetical protein